MIRPATLWPRLSTNTATTSLPAEPVGGHDARRTVHQPAWAGHLRESPGCAGHRHGIRRHLPDAASPLGSSVPRPGAPRSWSGEQPGWPERGCSAGKSHTRRPLACCTPTGPAEYCGLRGPTLPGREACPPRYLCRSSGEIDSSSSVLVGWSGCPERARPGVGSYSDSPVLGWCAVDQPKPEGLYLIHWI